MLPHKKKVCIKCKQKLALDRFEKPNIRTCKLCRSKRKVEIFTSSHFRFLKTVYVQLRYSRQKQGISWKIIPEDLYELWEEQRGRCALSGEQLTLERGQGGLETNVSVDRIDPKGVYEKKNIQLVAKRVNLMKHTMNETEFLQWVLKIYKNSHGRKI